MIGEHMIDQLIVFEQRHRGFIGNPCNLAFWIFFFQPVKNTCRPKNVADGFQFNNQNARLFGFVVRADIALHPFTLVE
jgi:hypothetical protein